MAYNEVFASLVIYSIFSVLSLTSVEANYELRYIRASKNPRNLTSPNYPDPYPSNASIVWWIYSSYLYSDIHLHFMFLDIEDSNSCENDNLTIYQHLGSLLEKIVEVCGNTTTHERIELGNDAIVAFKTNNNTEGKGFILQYYIVEDDDSQDRDNNHQKGYTSNWGTAIIIVFAITATVLIAAVAVACYCQRKQKQSNVQNFSDAAVGGDQDRPKF